MIALADTLSFTLARADAFVVALGVKYLANVEPPKIEPEEVDKLKSTIAEGLKEVFAIGGIKWWHVFAAQNAGLFLRLAATGRKLEPTKPLAPPTEKAAA